MTRKRGSTALKLFPPSSDAARRNRFCRWHRKNRRSVQLRRQAVLPLSQQLHSLPVPTSRGAAKEYAAATRLTIQSLRSSYFRYYLFEHIVRQGDFAKD